MHFSLCLQLRLEINKKIGKRVVWNISLLSDIVPLPLPWWRCANIHSPTPRQLLFWALIILLRDKGMEEKMIFLHPNVFMIFQLLGV